MSEASGNGRNANGQFAEGNPGGPGRPRRSVERDYLATLSDTVTTDAWAQICARAVEDAKGGDAKAREWLTRHCIGKEPQSLMELAVKESRGVSSEDEVDQKVEREARRDHVVAGYESIMAQFEQTPEVEQV